MAGRQHRMLLKENLGIEDEHKSDICDESSSIDDQVEKPVFNPFSLLTDDDEDDDEEEEEDNSDTELPQQKEPPATKRNTKTTSTKKASAPHEEDIDQLLQELNITPLPPTPSTTTHTTPPWIKPLMSIDFKCLNGEEELKKRFGAHRGNDPSSSARDAFAGASRRIRRLAARGLISRAALRPGHFMTPRESWPPLQHNELSMQLVNGSSASKERMHSRSCTSNSASNTPAIARTDRNGRFAASSVSSSPPVPTYCYMHSETYKTIQRLYEECQATLDPNAIAALLQRYPWHVDSLLTMADLYRSMGENAYADELMDRCLYVLELAWPSTLVAALTSGQHPVRVPYEVDENYALHVVLFKYVHAMGRRGLHRTALEACKLLLTLDADDPMGMLCTIDYFAVRSEQYEYLYRFIEEYKDGSAGVLPNMVYSVALARWYEERGEMEGVKGGRNKKKGGQQVGAKESDGSSDNIHTSSIDLLTKAIAMHPLVLIRLQKKVQEKGGGGDGRWQKALLSPILVSRAAMQEKNGSLGHLVDIFVERQCDLWRSSHVQSWLLQATERVIQAAGPNDNPGSHNQGTATGLVCDGASVLDWHSVGMESFPSNDTENKYNHLRIYEFSDAVARLPPEDIHGMREGAMMGGAGNNMEGTLAAELQEELERQLMLQQQQGGAANVDMNPWMALLRSFVPWNDDGQQPNYEDDDHDQHGSGP